MIIDAKYIDPSTRYNLPVISGVAFRVVCLASAQIIWIASDLKSDVPQWHWSPTARDFLSKYGYAIVGSVGYDESMFSLDKCISAWGERYGGVGIGKNGGGVRVANFNGAQVKGIGRNPLAGRSTQFMHSYGGLPAAEAIYEAVYCRILNYTLPVGAAKVLGVIATGPKAAYCTSRAGPLEPADESSRCWGALLVREPCMRPAHFLQAPWYEVLEEYKPVVGSDVARVRSVSKKFVADCGGYSGLAQFLGVFLDQCAKQFAAAKVNGIAHGALTPSNLAFDGRWLDLARSTFLPSDENNGAFVPFCDEQHYPIKLIHELCHSLSKYGRISINVALLVEYYREQFESYEHFFAASYFGIELRDVGVSISESDYMEFARGFLAVRNRQKVRTENPPRFLPESDAVLRYVVWIASPLNLAAMPDLGISDVLLKTKKIFDNWSSSCSEQPYIYGYSEISVRIARAFNILKRVRLVEFFYRKKLFDVILLRCSNAEIGALRDLTNSLCGVADWAFEKENILDSLCLFSSPVLSIKFLTATQRLCIESEASQRYLRMDEFYEFVHKAPTGTFEIFGHCFGSYLRSVSRVALEWVKYYK